MDVSILEVYGVFVWNNVNIGGVYIEKNWMFNFICGEGLVCFLDDIWSIVIWNENGIFIIIDDVAEKVYFGY